MTERLEEIVGWKSRVLTAQAQRMADDAARLNRDLEGVRAKHRGAMESFESVRRRTRESSESADPRSGRFYVEALRSRLIVERGAIRKIEERLAEGELRVSRVQGEISTAIARLKRLQEIRVELRAKEAAGRERRVEENLRELWSAGERGNGDLFLDGVQDFVPHSGPRIGELVRVTEQDIREGAGVARAKPVEDIGDSPPPEGRTRGGRGADGGEFAGDIGGDSPGGAMAGPVSPSAFASARSRAPEGAGEESRFGSNGSPPVIGGRHEIGEGATEARGGAIEQGGERGVSLTYRGAAGGAIAVGIAQRPNGALDVEFHTERPRDRYRLERERRGLLESLRARGYDVERLVISGIGREGREDGGR